MSVFFSAMSSKYDRNRNRLKIGPIFMNIFFFFFIFMNLDDIYNMESMTSTKTMKSDYFTA